MKTSRFDVVLMDFFGTLAAGDVQAVEDVCTAVIRDLRLNETAAGLAQRWGRSFFQEMEACNAGVFRTILECECTSLEKAVATLGPAIDARPYMESMIRYCQNPPLHEEVHEVLLGLNVPVCVVSNADEHDLRLALNSCGLVVHAAVSSEAARSYKPDRRIFEIALDRMGVAPARCLHVGDSLHSDVRGAAALGITTAWVVRGVRIGDVADGVPAPDHTLTSLRELTAIL